MNPVTTPPDTVAVAVAWVLPPAPVKVTVGAEVYPLPGLAPMIPVIEPVNRDVSAMRE